MPVKMLDITFIFINKAKVSSKIHVVQLRPTDGYINNRNIDIRIQIKNHTITTKDHMLHGTDQSVYFSSKFISKSYCGHRTCPITILSVFTATQAETYLWTSFNGVLRRDGVTCDLEAITYFFRTYIPLCLMQEALENLHKNCQWENKWYENTAGPSTQ